MFFRNFSSPLWKIFFGNLLLLFCSLFYLAWWIISFRPNSQDESAGGLYIMLAFITGFVAISLMVGGINSLSQASKGLQIRFILLGSIVLFLLLIPITTIVFNREMTSELIIILIWATMELSAVTVLYGTGRFDMNRTVILVVLVGVATIAGLICYILYYRLDVTASYWVGMVPLAADAIVMAVFLGALSVKKQTLYK